MKNILITILLTLSHLLIFGQHGKIIVIDSKSKESIPFAHVCFEELGGSKKEYLVSDKEGSVINPVNKPYIIAISYIGYKNYVDTLQPNKNYEIALIPQVFDLDQVVVTASFTPQKADKSIYSVKVIDSRKIELKAANNLADVLKDEVNIQVTNDPSLGSGLKIKGLSGNNVKILIDGVPVIGRMGGNVDLSQLSLYNIDHVEVVEGPMSVIYGSNALAGAINIITKENTHSNHNITVNSYIENLGTYNLDATVGLKKGKSNFTFSGGRNFFNGVYLDIDKNRSQTWKPKELYNTDFLYTFTNKNYKIKFQSSYMLERLLDKGDQQGPSFNSATDNWFRSMRLSNRVEYNQKLKNDFFLNILGSHSFYNRQKLSYLKDFLNSTSKLVNDVSQNDTTKLNAFSYKLLFGNQNQAKKFNFISGVDFNYEIANGKRIYEHKQTIGDYAVFTSLTLNLSNQVSFQPGLRYSYNTKFNSPVVPSVNIKWNPSRFLNIRASYVRGFRAPSLKELYISFKDISHDIQPNPNLKPESGNNFDLSFSINTDKKEKLHFTNVELSLFYNQLNSSIYLAPKGTSTDSTTYLYINISHLNTLGGQLNFKYSYYPRFDFGIGFGETGIYASSKNSNTAISNYKFSPDASLTASYLIPGIEVKAFVNYKYSGFRYTPSIDDKKEVVWGTMAEYHTIDISFNKKFHSNKLTFSLGVKNLLDNQIVARKGVSSGDTPHTSGDGSPVGYGRLFFTSLTYNIHK